MNGINADEVSSGESFSCWGRMGRPITFTYDGVEHKNDLNSCHYTPLKGMIRFHENADDWRALHNAYGRAIKALTTPNTPYLPPEEGK